MCVLSITPDAGLEVSGYAHYIELTIGGAAGRISENYRTENGVAGEPVLTTAITEDPCIFPRATVTALPTAGAWVFGLTVGARGTAGNKVVVKLALPTLRPAA